MTTNNHLPKPPNTTEYEFRPARLEDAPAIHRTQVAIDAHDSREWAETLADMAGDQVVGFSLNYLSPEENERNGIQEAWVGELAVRRPWRKRGFATALLNQSKQAFEAEGLDYATLGVDTENPTGALGVYERVGFTAVKRSISFAKTIHEPRD